MMGKTVGASQSLSFNADHELADAAYQKATALLQADCVFNEFGTRRRRSARTQEIILQGILRAEHDHPGKGKVNGTSNVINP